jgi:hypothetical protein
MKSFLCVLLSATIAFSQGKEKVAVALVGGGGGRKFIQRERYRNKSGDIRLEAGTYAFQPEPIMVFQKGVYFGAEFNAYQIRPYLGLTYLIIGFNAPDKLPLIYLGASSGAIGEINGRKPYWMDGGIEASVWLATLLGSLQLSERVMVQEWYQTRLDYLFKLPFFGERPRKAIKNGI